MKKEILILCAFLLMASTAAGFLNFAGQEEGTVAIISLEGEILPSSQPGAFSSGGAITPEKLRELHSKAEKKDVDAVIYEINSPGGSVVASKDVMREMESLDLPQVCRFRDAAASGAYLAALGCDRIVADSASLTGSIGVKSSYLEFSGLLDRYGVEYVNITSGKHKEVGSPFKNASEEEKQLLKEKTDAIHQQFVSNVEENRNLTEQQTDAVGTGELLLGSEAKEYGLVDELGGRDTAIETAENLTGKDLQVEKIETEPSFNFLSLLLSSPINEIMDRGPLLKAVY